MKNERLENKLAKWVDKTQRGEKGFQGYTCGPNGNLYLGEGVSDEIISAIAYLWRGNRILAHHVWGEEKTSSEGCELVAVLKEKKKLLLMDKDAGVFASGASEDSEEAATRAVLYFRCKGIATLIAASSDLPTAQVVEYLLDEEYDPLQMVLHDLLGHIPTGIQGEEAADNA